ncbi:MAG: bifunctional folylpolyglutamate synthase/dihydrofolate synthase [Bacteroidetes bacterium]|nr:bifunctional folylpolyglutamate synthase/dihydrofolate synthase [Bacteroidota bacterium]
MNYQQTLDYLFSQLPMFQRIGSAAYKADLNNTLAICKLLGNPEKQFKSIHIAGTNGKGSTSHMLASILHAAGFKVGLYTSPHLKDFRERIRVNGKMISQKSVVDFVERHKKDFEIIKPSFFEMTVGLAFDHFAKEKVDIAIIEVGLGGRLDSTNVISPLLSVITNISYDHTNLLGDTLEKIAEEKAGIIKPTTIAVIGETQSKVASVFLKHGKEKRSGIFFSDVFFDLKNIKQSFKESEMFLSADVFFIKNKHKEEVFRIECDLPGMYQVKNIRTVLCSIFFLKTVVGFRIPDNAILIGLSSVKKRTGLKGRWQILSRKPLVIADTGHNEAGIREVLDQIKLMPHKKLHFVLGMVNDKDISKILGMLPKDAIYYFCKANIPRALPASELALQANNFGLNGNVYESVQDAFIAAKKRAAKNDFVFIGGSTFTVAEVI